MKTVILYFAKKYIVKSLQELFVKHKDDIVKISQTTTTWIERLKKIVECLSKINERVSDGILDDDEIQDSVSEISVLVKEF